MQVMVQTNKFYHLHNRSESLFQVQSNGHKHARSSHSDVVQKAPFTPENDNPRKVSTMLVNLTPDLNGNYLRPSVLKLGQLDI